MTHIKYPKIYRLGHEDTDGILEGTCVIQEKIDGANASIWIDNGAILTGSRTREVSNESFNGFTQWANTHEGVRNLLEAYPDYRLYGEWLIKHTVQYNETAYRKFYLYDIFYNFVQNDGGEFTADRLPPDQVKEIAEKYQINYPAIFAILDKPSIDDIKQYVGKTELGEHGEGVVIKNMDFVNRWGNKTYAKVVTESFKENNAVTFGGNNKHSESYHEMWCVNKFMTLGRIEKLMNKIQPQIEKRLDMEHTARIINTAYHDMLTEEIWTIQKKCPSISFRTLARLSQKKAAQIYHDILNNSLSIADANLT